MRHRVFDLVREIFLWLVSHSRERVRGWMEDAWGNVTIPLLLGNSLAAHRFLRSFAAAHQAWPA